IQMWVGEPTPPGDSQVEWFKDLSCDEIECLEHTGACCDGTTGDCEDNVPESECPTADIPPGIGTCENKAQCNEPCPAIGACMTDSDCGPGGICLPGCVSSFCTCDENGTWNCTDDCNGLCASVPNQNHWEKDTLCGELDPPCEEHTGACCDGTTGDCEDGVPESDCPVGCFGECVGGSYCDDADCCVDPDNCPVCYEPNDQISIELCGDCFGECINGSYCDHPDPNCCVGDACQCFSPNHPVSIRLCGECFGECIKGSYCDSSADPDCCVEPGNCVCYAPDHPVSIKLCSAKPDPDNQYRWEKGVSCTELDPPCEEHTGACCDGTTGDCENDVPESECPVGATPGGIGFCDNEAACTSPCPAFGACQTDSDCGPGGTCLPGCIPSQCTCDANNNWICTDDCNGQCAAVPNQNHWEKDTLCSELDPSCEEHTGACCDEGNTGECIDDVPESECQFERWEKDTPCDELDPPCDGGICNPDCIRDIDGDGHVNAFDLAVLLGCWGQITPGSTCECFDKDGDGFITAFDLASLLGAWGLCP
ncbi:MAG: hypothetical protein IIB58_05475, partial [Planctomycetes bacterium]|nr:hypothetical protein [Planctomycetota bacterium]